jgi:hypothetical protein
MEAREREFHVSDVLSITTGLLLSTRHIDGVYDILNFMTGDKLFTHQLPRASDECKPYLQEQFPQLFTPEMDFAVAELREMLKTKSGKKEPEKLILGWLSKLTSGQYKVKCDEKLMVKAIPQNAHAVKDPMEEAAEMMGGDREKVIGVVL